MSQRKEARGGSQLSTSGTFGSTRAHLQIHEYTCPTKKWKEAYLKDLAMQLLISLRDFHVFQAQGEQDQNKKSGVRRMHRAPTLTAPILR